MKSPKIKTADELARIAGRLDHWMRGEAWPLWWPRNRHKNGAFYEALDYEGQPVPRNVARVRVQARQIFSFALARSLGWRADGLEQGITDSLDRFLDTCLGPQGLPGMLIDIEQGQMTDPTPNLYVTAFMLMALAQSRGLAGEATQDRRICRLLDDIDRHLAYSDGQGYRETLPRDTARYQNPHMHFYESLLCLYAATGDPAAGQRAESLLGFVRDTFFDVHHGVVRERVSTENGAAGQHYEPGHSMEWVWLLGYRSRLFHVPLDPFAIQLYNSVLSSGFPEGKLPMRLTFDHEPVDSTCRLWSQTEALKAHLCILELGPDHLFETALQRATNCAESILEFWLDTACKGLFYDQFDAAGKLIAENVPASMGYHLYVAIAELRRFVNRLPMG